MYEIDKRELRARFFSAKYFVEKGYKVIIFQHLEIYLIALFAKPGIIFLKSNSSEFDLAILLMKKRGFRVVLSQEEGLHFDYGLINSITFSTKSADLVDAYFAWHPADADFAKRNGVSPFKIRNVGNIRFELASRMDKPDFSNDRTLGILLIANFDTFIEYIAPKKIENPDIALAYKKQIDDINNWSNVEKLNKNLYEGVLKSKLVDQFNISFRPYTLAKNSYSSLVHIVLDTHSNILDSIAANDIIIHYGSTVGLESILSGRLSILLNAHPELVDKRIRESSICIKSLDELFALLNQISRDRKILQTYSKLQFDKMKSNYEMDFTETNWLIECEKQVNLFVPRNHFKVLEIRLTLKNLSYYLKIHLKRIVIRPQIIKAQKLDSVRVASELSALGLNSRFKVKIWLNRKVVTLHQN